MFLGIRARFRDVITKMLDQVFFLLQRCCLLQYVRRDLFTLATRLDGILGNAQQVSSCGSSFKLNDSEYIGGSIIVRLQLNPDIPVIPELSPGHSRSPKRGVAGAAVEHLSGPFGRTPAGFSLIWSLFAKVCCWCRSAECLWHSPPVQFQVYSCLSLMKSKGNDCIGPDL